jgi:aminoglycoside phosphotransferase family enzyme/predicted kinase
MVSEYSFDHVIKYLRRTETHMSWVFLTGDFAYKIKKPVNLGFADFSTLKRRKYYCERELELNRRMAPQLYIDVVPVGGSAAKPRFGRTPEFEYAVKMFEFDQADLLIRLLEAGGLERADIVKLGTAVAASHAGAECASPDSEHGRIRSITKPITDNYRDLRKQQLPRAIGSRLEQQCAYDLSRLRTLRATFSARRHEGRIRDCHGDLHLGNLVRIDGEIVPFDRLEFDPALRWIDVMNEAAFPYMDLRYRDRDDLAFEYLNTYCEYGGDYSGLAVLPVYASYKAMIRAKVGAHDQSLSTRDREREIESHLCCAERLSRPKPGRVVLMHGLSCSGKSYASDALKVQLPAIRIRADVERKRSAGLGRHEDSHSGVGERLYDAAATRSNYRHLCSLARLILTAGFDVIVDAAFLQTWQRQLFLDLAEELDRPLFIIDCKAPAALLRHRLETRAATGDSTSEAGHEVLDWQLQHVQALTRHERERSITVDMSVPFDGAATVSVMGNRQSPPSAGV